MKNLLLATDLGANSDRAMERAIKIAKECDATLHILHVLNDESNNNTSDTIKAYIKDYKDADSIDVKITVTENKKPHDEIPRHAVEVDAGIIIMGTHAESKFSDLFFGTTIERVLVNSATPILMVKDKPLNSYQNVLCGIDFAPASKDAFKAVTSIAPNAVFELLHTYDDPPVYPNPQFLNTMGRYTLSEEEREKEMVNFINTQTEDFQNAHPDKTLKLQYSFIKSDPYYGLIKEAESKKADLLCVGAYGEPSEKIGAVTDSIMADPPCDILVSGARE